MTFRQKSISIRLYIPIWFYSNGGNNKVVYYSQSFTFQSGSIQINLQSIMILKVYPLHSNLVLFKSSFTFISSGVIILYIPIWFYSNFLASKNDESFSRFTFQSGSIQIRQSSVAVFFVCNFTFQSGSIQIRPYHTTYLYRLKSTFLSTDK